MQLLIKYDWPGNVRELQHAIERAHAVASGAVLHATDLPPQVLDYHARRRETDASASEDHRLKSTLARASSAIVSIAEIEKQAIQNTVQKLNGDKLMASKLLGIGKTTLYRKLKEYGLAGAI